MLASEAFDLFLLSYEGSKSLQTIHWYRRRLADLVAFLGEAEIVSVTIHDLRRWRVALCARQLSIWSVHGYVRAARHWFKWLADEGIVPANVAARLELPKLPKEPRKGLLLDQMEAIIAVADTLRDRALALFFASTLCRLGGIVHLCLGDLDLGAGRALVREKGSKARVVFLSPDAVEAMVAWLEIRPDSADDHVFLGKRGPLTGNGVYQAMKRLAKAAGVERGWNPHSWRHGMARELQRRGMPTGVLSQLLGHSGVDVTVRFYGTATEDELGQAHQRYSPLA